jgi:hypothetical protein
MVCIEKERQLKYNQRFKALNDFILHNGMLHARPSKGSDDPPCRVIPVSETFDRIKQVHIELVVWKDPHFTAQSIGVERPAPCCPVDWRGKTRTSLPS